MALGRSLGGCGFSVRPATGAFAFVVFTTWQSCGGVVPAACALTCSPTVCPAAGPLVSLGRGGAGVGHRWLALMPLRLWPVWSLPVPPCDAML